MFCFIMPTCSIEGIVVAMENEGVILEGWEQEEQIRMEKANKVCSVRVYTWYALKPPPNGI